MNPLVSKFHRNVLPKLVGYSAAYTYSWPKEIDKILPQFYKNSCVEFLLTKPKSIHYIPKQEKFKWDKYRVIPVQNIDIEVTFPPVCNEGLWGGEGVVKGYSKEIIAKRRFKPRIPRVWMPYLKRRAVYSEILDQWMAVTVTPTTEELINEHLGFDYYILETCERHLNSQLAMHIKRMLLIKLAEESMHPDDPVKKEKVLRRYKKFAIPLEEAEFVGLTVDEAVDKVKIQMQEKYPIVPLKEKLVPDFIKFLQDKKEVEIAKAKEKQNK